MNPPLVVCLCLTVLGLAFLPGWMYCKVGLHKWDEPGGHCEECGDCDEFFGPHCH